MRLLLLLTLLELRAAAAAFHSLTYVVTASSGVQNFPEYLSVGLVDGVEFYRYDSNSRRAEPKQDWVDRVVADDPQYLEEERQREFNVQQIYKNNIEVAKQRFNQTGGVHIFQRMYGCEWDDETGKVWGYDQYAYDGEDFIVFDLKTLTWVAPNPQAVVTKHKWDREEGRNKYLQYYYTQECPEWLKKYLDYGKSRLLRTELPSVALLQKEATSPIVCHATGFYPRGAIMFWTKDGEDSYKDVDMGEVLPNPDGTFQMTAELSLSDPSVDWGRFSCVFQLAGVEEDLVTRLSPDAILTNRKPNRPGLGGGVLAAAVLGPVVLLALIALCVWFFVYRQGKDKPPPSSVDTSEEFLEQLNPEPLTPAP